MHPVQESTWLPTAKQPVQLPQGLTVSLQPSSIKGFSQMLIAPNSGSEYVNVNLRGQGEDGGKECTYMNVGEKAANTEESTYMNTEEARKVRELFVFI